MEPGAVGALAIALMFLLIVLHVPVGVAMAISGVLCYSLFVGLGPALSVIGIEFTAAIGSLDLAVIPLFLLLGSVANVSGLSRDLYRLLHAFVGHRRGGLAAATIGTCAGFGALCGSSLATVAAMTRTALPEMLERGYSPPLAAGSVAAGGTLGMLIPPSAIIVVYAVLTEQLVLTLFVATLVPALLAVVFHVLAIGAFVRIAPEAAPAGARFSWGHRLRVGRRNWALVALGAVITAGIYGGLLTVLEAAGVGVIFSICFALGKRALNPRALGQVVSETATSTGMIYMIIVGAWSLTYVLAASGLPEAVFARVEALELPPLVVVFGLYVIYLVLGCVFDSIATMVITLPFVLPIVDSFGYDPLWWGVVMIVIIEIGLITPPIGINVLILHGMAPTVPLRQIFLGVLPFLVADLLRLTMLTVFPRISLWLPNALGMN